MKLSPHSRATRTLPSTSSSVTLRNSAPREEAPKPRMGSWRPVRPRGRVGSGVAGMVKFFEKEERTIGKRGGNVQRRTSNIERPTSNGAGEETDGDREIGGRRNRG